MKRPPATALLPTGFVDLATAIDLAGRIEFPDEWTGLRFHIFEVNPLASKIQVMSPRIPRTRSTQLNIASTAPVPTPMYVEDL